MNDTSDSPETPSTSTIEPPHIAPSGNGKAIMIGIAAGAVTFLAMCGILALVGVVGLRSGTVRDALTDVANQLDEQDSFGPEGPVWMGSPNVWYCANGEIAVAQMIDDNAQPIVVAWSEQWDELKIAEGYRVVAVERAAPVLWLVEDSSTDITNESAMLSDFPDTANDLFYQPVDDLLSWQLDDQEQPLPATELDWAEWEGPGEATVILHIDPSIASEPSSATFRVGNRTVEAQLPPGTEAFEPVGWCPDGDHFAILTLADLSTLGGMVEFESDFTSGSTEASEEPSTNLVLIIDVATGKVTSETSVGWASEMMGNAGLAAWSGTSDMLYVLQIESPGADWVQGLNLLAVSPDGESTSIGSWSDAFMAWIRFDPSGEPMMMLGDGMTSQLWRLDPVKPKREDSWMDENSVTMASDWTPNHGLLVLIDEGYSDTPNSWSSGGAHVFGLRDGGETRELYRIDDPAYW